MMKAMADLVYHNITPKLLCNVLHLSDSPCRRRRPLRSFWRPPLTFRKPVPFPKRVVDPKPLGMSCEELHFREARPPSEMSF